MKQPSLPLSSPIPLSVRPGKADKMREKLLRKWDYECAYQCGTVLTVGTMTFDHVIAKSKGGKKPRNLVPACGPCNLTKGAFVTVKELDEYYARARPLIAIAEKIAKGELKPKW